MPMPIASAPQGPMHAMPVTKRKRQGRRSQFRPRPYDAERNASDAQNAARDAAAGQAQAEQDTASAQQGEMNAKAEADQNQAAAMSSEQPLQQAVHDREELRARLLVQFNTILETRDTARGLVVNMSDVLFDSGKFTLRSPPGRSWRRFPASSWPILRCLLPSKATPIALAVPSAKPSSPS